ncbi:hypothetical protein L6654_41440 [Bradyrhizobium sp. WYCCWR 13023]|uniref:Uncharacterized protein n=1 Tax=Bradyrhizobium zhengyangense TaxID=2911009 RepID=A0A9X1UFH3_9BRAD|nr:MULTISPECIES: hypothetical protein [Bradyrhizobium]MCG2633028.1 hypothetical protein [Bradyrhizobium zhengyangense]MCG2673226.1 hypothetical protein [Bradyrhizobium zhengyangense]
MSVDVDQMKTDLERLFLWPLVSEEFRAGITLAQERDWIELHESRKLLRLTQTNSLA